MTQRFKIMTIAMLVIGITCGTLLLLKKSPRKGQGRDRMTVATPKGNNTPLVPKQEPIVQHSTTETTSTDATREKEIDAFFKDLPSQQTTTTEVSPNTKVSAKPTKPRFKAATFMDPSFYNISIAEVNKKFTGYRFKSDKSRMVFLDRKNSVFPKATQWAIDYNGEGLNYLRYKFAPKDNTLDSCKALQEELITDLTQRFGQPLSSKQRNSFAYQSAWRSKGGLAIVLDVHYPGNAPRSEIAIAYIKVNSHFKKIASQLSHLDIPKNETPRKTMTKPIVPRKIIYATKAQPAETVPRVSFQDFITNPKLNPFSLGGRDFDRQYLKNFDGAWTDHAKISARTASPLKLLGITSKETIFSFRKGKLERITLMVYNKGDDDSLSKSSFVMEQEAVIKALTVMTGKKPQYKPHAGIAKNYLHWWLTDKYLIKLESNYTETRKTFSSEYVRLSFTPAVSGLTAVNIDKISSKVLSNQELLSLITRDKDGAVYLSGIPMVDQGQKGYCACATTARILNYYGRDIDQHDIAKLTLSSARGTKPEDLKKALASISAKLRLNVATIVKCFLSSENDIKRFLKKLEYAYKKHDFVFNNYNLDAKELKVVFSEMALKESRYKEFKRGIIRSINLGRPLAWALMLGIVPEPEIPQASGGHMRLIIGYNEVTDEIYYSDTWGAGHEKKVMDMTSAFWISCALWEIRPR